MYLVVRFVPGRRVVKALKKLIVNCGKGPGLEEGRKRPGKGM
jgi:hypothetical protein